MSKKFTKYARFGAYHWDQYEDKNTKYSRHADRVKEWVKEKEVLDIGAGDGKITHLLDAVGIDDELEAVRLAQEKGASVILGSAYKLPYIDGAFESAFIGDVLEHLKEPERAIQEARRVITKYLYIANPIKGMDNDPFHYQEWTPEELTEIVELQGFSLEESFSVPKDKRDYLKFKKI